MLRYLLMRSRPLVVKIDSLVTVDYTMHSWTKASRDSYAYHEGRAHQKPCIQS